MSTNAPLQGLRLALTRTTAAPLLLGLSGAHIMFREILPNAIGPIIVAATLTVARAILMEAYISFLGYGIQPPLPSRLASF